MPPKPPSDLLHLAGVLGQCGFVSGAIRSLFFFGGGVHHGPPPPCQGLAPTMLVSTTFGNTLTMDTHTYNHQHCDTSARQALPSALCRAAECYLIAALSTPWKVAARCCVGFGETLCRPTYCSAGPHLLPSLRGSEQATLDLASPLYGTGSQAWRSVRGCILAANFAGGLGRQEVHAGGLH